MAVVPEDSEYIRFFTRAADACGTSRALRLHEDALRDAVLSYEACFSVALVGRMKQGKSTIMNALAGEPLAPVGVVPTTATINVFQHGKGSPQVVWRNGREEAIALSDVSSLFSGDSPDVLERIRETRHINFFSQAESLNGRKIIDTPGTESGIAAHEEVIRSFLCEAAAIIYVMQYPGREGDLTTLRSHQGEKAMGANISNSLAVVHLWEADTSLSEAVDPLETLSVRALEIGKSLQGVVRVVLPVSGALAFCARYEPDEWWHRLLSLIGDSPRDKLVSALDSPDRWRRNQARSRLYDDDYPHMNWNSFRLICFQIMHHGITDSTVARKHILRLSQIERLEEEMRERFFSKARLIKLSKLFQTVAPHVDSAMVGVRSKIEHARSGLEAISELLRNGSNGPAIKWMLSEQHRLEKLLPDLEKAQQILDKQWQPVKRGFTNILLDEEVSDRLAQIGIPAGEAGVPLAKDVLVNPRKKRRPEAVQAIRELIPICRKKAATASSKHRDLLEHLTERLTRALCCNS